jgi:hypothetical protein
MRVRKYYENHNDNGHLECPECESIEVDGYKWLPAQEYDINRVQGWWSRCCDCGAWFPERLACTTTDVPPDYVVEHKVAKWVDAMITTT